MKAMINPMRFFTGIIFPGEDPVKAGISICNGVLFQSHGMQRRIAHPLSSIFSLANALMPDSWRPSMHGRYRQRVPCFCGARIQYSFTLSWSYVFPKMIENRR
jgi:hypothetical protein